MARLTVEDCLKKESNRFELIITATKRARDLERGMEATIPWENDKPTVMALREIAAGNIQVEKHGQQPQKQPEVIVTEIEEKVVVTPTETTEE